MTIKPETISKYTNKRQYNGENSLNFVLLKHYKLISAENLRGSLQEQQQQLLQLGTAQS